jgi:hypothetical protein
VVAQPDASLSEHALRNRAVWNADADDYQARQWIRLFRANGFEVLDLIEPRPAADAVSSYRDDEDRDWARRWPAECIWRLRRT